ncbi:MAG TPA: PPOX class F420-dependent oxidoreductase [Acidimicrobiales bacterium]|nr:PPOX class F420-dependent oxidoreductase [Acidimicrobiales bacterium]
MTLTDTEARFLTAQPRVYLATVGPDGVPQVKPVGFTYNASLGTVDITGMDMGSSAKYRNVQRNPKVALAVDEVSGTGIAGVRMLEIRGVAETARREPEPGGQLAAEIIRVHPRRVLTFNLRPGQPGFEARDVPAQDVESRGDGAGDVS